MGDIVYFLSGTEDSQGDPGFRFSFRISGQILKLILLCIILSPASFADRLPTAVPETQLFTIDTMVDAVGSIDEATRFDWTTVKNGTVSSDTTLGKGEIVSAVVYADTLLSNGGNISEVKNLGFDSASMSTKSFNIDSEKVLTYTSAEGSHLVGEETLLLNVAGNYSSDKTDSIRCVLATSDTYTYPAFCNVVRAKSELVNLNSGQISTKGQIRALGTSSSTSAGLNYQIAVTPDSGSGLTTAQGTVKTEFAGSILEARDAKKSTGSSSKKKSKTTSSSDWNTTAATNEWKDATEVTGGIVNLQKVFGYQSGMRV